LLPDTCALRKELSPPAKERPKAMEVEQVRLEPEASILSGETLSQVTDPVGSWLLDSPCGGTKEQVGVFQPSPGDLVTAAASPDPVAGLVTEETAPLAAAQRAVAPETGGHTDELLKEATAAVSMAKGKRTKVVTVGITKTQTRLSTRNTGAASHVPALEKAQRRAAEKNLDAGNFSALDAYLILICRLRLRTVV
jgi:hypothetical protein